VAPDTILKEMQKGYMIHDRLVRPSMVVVSKVSQATSVSTEKESQ